MKKTFTLFYMLNSMDKGNEEVFYGDFTQTKKMDKKLISNLLEKVEFEPRDEIIENIIEFSRMLTEI